MTAVSTEIPRLEGQIVPRGIGGGNKHRNSVVFVRRETGLDRRVRMRLRVWVGMWMAVAAMVPLERGLGLFRRAGCWCSVVSTAFHSWVRGIVEGRLVQ